MYRVPVATPDFCDPWHCQPDQADLTDKDKGACKKKVDLLLVFEAHGAKIGNNEYIFINNTSGGVVGHPTKHRLLQHVEGKTVIKKRTTSSMKTKFLDYEIPSSRQSH
jgi:hypothetical protein